MTSTEMVQQYLEFLEVSDNNLIAYQLKDNANGDEWTNILVVYNGNAEYKTLDIPTGNWKVVLDGERMNEEGLGTIAASQLTVPGRSAMVLAQ